MESKSEKAKMVEESDEKSGKENNEWSIGEAIRILGKPDLLGFIDKAFEEKGVNKAIKGETNSKLTALLLCSSMNLGYYLMVVFKGSSSIGKTNMANMVTGLFKTKKIGELSPTALKYSDEDCDYRILYHQETSEKESRRKSFKFISSDDGGFTAETTIKNPETGKFEIQNTEVAAKGFVTTTTAIELDKEFSTRSFMIPLDESAQQTDTILDYNLSETERKMAQIDGNKQYGKKYNDLKNSLEYLESYEVVIPFENEIKGLFPRNPPLRVRRDSKKLITVIKASALLFQYQRPKIIVNNEVLLVATWQDLYNGIRIAMPIMDATMTGFDARTAKAIKLLPEIVLEHNAITSENLANSMSDIGKNYAGRILKQLNESGYVYEDTELKNELGIRGKTKVYALNNKSSVKTCNSAIQDIDWTKVVKKQEKFLARYSANCENNEKHKVIVEYYLAEYNRFGRVVYDPIDHHYKKLEQDDSQILQFAVLTSDELNTLKRAICQHVGCKKPKQDVVIKAQTAIAKIDLWDFLDSQFYHEYLDAEQEIIKILDNPILHDHKNMVKTEKIVDIVYSIFEYSENRIYNIIDNLKKEGDVVEPEDGYLKLNLI